MPSFALVASLASASDPDGNGLVLQPFVKLIGQTAPGAAIEVSAPVPGTSPAQARADALGRFEVGLALAPGANRFDVAATDGLGQRASVQATVFFGDVILDWNAVHLTALRDFTTVSQVPFSNRIVHTAPPLAARNLALMHIAMFDAVNAISRTHAPYRVDITAAPGTAAAAAGAAAAHRILSSLYPHAEQLVLFDAALTESLASVADGAGEALGVELGRRIADEMLSWRSSDGARAVKAFTPGTAPGDWRRTDPDFLPPLMPQWPEVTPFFMPGGDAHRVAPPPVLGSAEYTAAFNEVKELGRFDSTARTPEQTEIALFWADGPGTFTPPGHWNQIAHDVALRRGHTLVENARLFALLNIAMADAGIASWDAKYEYVLWRPIAAIREADTDGNEQTSADAGWTPLLKTPPFPSYTSGHSTFSGAAAAVLAELYGDAHRFTSRADGLEGFTQRPLAQVMTRSFASFSAAAVEASRSRIYGGIHYEFDGTAGLEAGHAIGRSVAKNLLRADPGPIAPATPGPAASSTATAPTQQSAAPVTVAASSRAVLLASPRLNVLPRHIVVAGNGARLLTGPYRLRVRQSQPAATRLRIALRVTSGSLKLLARGQLERVTGNGRRTLIMVGSHAAIERALGRVQYRAARGFKGRARLWVTTVVPSRPDALRSRIDIDAVSLHIG